jgi:hypothetical protein
MRTCWAKVAVYAALATGLILVPARAASNLRSLTGMVTDKAGNALPGAVVQIENTRTLDVRSWITDKMGRYCFNELLDDVDYTVRAHYRRTWSRSRTLSKFNSKEKPEMTLVVPVD